MILKFKGGWRYPEGHECWNCGAMFMSPARNARWCPDCRPLFEHGHRKKHREKVYKEKGLTQNDNHTWRT